MPFDINEESTFRPNIAFLIIYFLVNPVSTRPFDESHFQLFKIFYTFMVPAKPCINV